MQKLLINPPQGGNEDIQSLPLGYLSAKWRAPVVDLNTCPSQVWDTSHDENLISVQSRSVGAARRIIEEHPQSTFRSVTTPIDVQCCYRFVPLQKNLHVLDLPGVPRYDLFSSYPTFKANWQSGMWPYALLTSLGCPYSCTYCDARNRQWSGWDGQRLREELTQAVDSYGVRVVTTLDDCINLHEDHVVRVSSLFSDFGIEWMCTNGLRADRLTEKSAKAMSWSGCKTVGFGIESSDQGVLDAIKKGEKVEDLERGIRIARDYFDSVSGFVILGLPGSSYDSDAQTLEWAMLAHKTLVCQMLVPSMQVSKMQVLIWAWHAMSQKKKNYSHVATGFTR